MGIFDKLKELTEIVDVGEAIEKVANSLTDLNVIDGLQKTPMSYNSEVYKSVSTIVTNVTSAFALTILAMFMLMEFIKLSEKVGYTDVTGAEAPIKLLIKYIVCEAFITNVKPILDGISQASVYLVKKTSEIVSSPESNIEKFDIAKKINEVDWGYGDQIMIGALCSICLLAITIVTFYIKVAVLGRMLELYMYIAISPIPVATMPSDEHSVIAKNFFKTFIATSVQAVLMQIIIAVYSQLALTKILKFSDMAEKVADNSSEIYSILGCSLIYAFLLAWMLSKTASMAKRLLNV